MSGKHKITPFLWYDGSAEEAVELYTSTFDDSRIVSVSRIGGGGKGEGQVMSITFELAGQRFIALNGGPKYKFTAAVSLFVSCETQEEVDRYWNKLLSGGGKPTACGWLEDRFGLSWQIIPTVLMELIGDANRERADRAMQAMLGMQKLDIAALKKAHAGK
ncbi:MAG: VOC family protein [Gemmatimonadales bacterium]